MSVAAVTLALASVIHFGVALPLGVATLSDHFPNAAIPEAVIAVILLAGVGISMVRPAAAKPVALATTAVATLGVLFGLSVTVRGPQHGDVAYHVSVLAVLLLTLGMLLWLHSPASSAGLHREAIP